MDKQIQLKVPRWMKTRLREITERDDGTMTNYVLEALQAHAKTAQELPDEADALIHLRDNAVGREILHLADMAALLRYGSTRRARNRVVRAALAEALRRDTDDGR